MSQAKVDKYKKEKANRQKIMKKQKWMHRFEMTGIALVAVLVVGWIGYSAYDKAASGDGSKETVVFDAGAVQDYLSDLMAE